MSGSIVTNGSKNAALPLLAATLLTKETVELSNIPNITDVNNMVRILQVIGANITVSKGKIKITTKSIDERLLPRDIVGKLRGSILLLGALLGRQAQAQIPEPGGDVIGARPIDVHLDAFQQLGATVKRDRHQVEVNGKNMKPGHVTLREFSVTATENVLLSAASLPGKTTIHIAANEPHVVVLARLLSSMGAKIRGAGTHTITVHGTRRLHSAKITNTSDMLEAGLFILLAAATKSTLAVRKVPVDDLRLFFKKIDDLGLNYEVKGSTVLVKPSLLKQFSVQTMPHPGIATDLQAPFAVMATQAEGTSLIHDPMYESRFRHCDELVKMGAVITVCDPHRVIIQGPTKLRGHRINSSDIRSGATLIMAGLVAEGETMIQDAEIIDRGYANLVERLQKIGADIKRID